MISHLLCTGIGFILGAGVMRAIVREPERESDREKQERWHRARWAPRDGEDGGSDQNSRGLK